LTVSSNRVFRKLALPALSVLIFLVCTEIGLRLLPQVIPIKILIEFEPGIRSVAAMHRGLQPRPGSIPIERDDGGPSDRLWRYRGGAEVAVDPEPGLVEVVTMDDEGFCNPETDAYATADHFDVIAIGDSFTFCTGVEPEEAWPARLSALTGWSAYNLGMPGRGLYEYIETLEVYGLPKSPRIVVMGVYEGNDVRDAYVYNQAQADPNRRVESELCPFESAHSCETFLALKHGALGRNSYLYNLLSGLLANYLHRSERLGVEFRYAVRFPDGKVLDFNSGNWDKNVVQYAHRLTTGLLTTSLFDDALQRFMALAEKHDFVPVLVFQPTAHSTYAGMTRFEDTSIESSLRASGEVLRSYFSERSQDLGYHYLDMTDHLQSEAERRSSREQLYFPLNLHYSQAGHELVARDLAQLLNGL